MAHSSVPSQCRHTKWLYGPIPCRYPLSLPKTPSARILGGRPNCVTLSTRVETIKTVLGTLLLLFQSRSRLHVEILVLRHHLVVLRRAAPKRVRLRVVDGCCLCCSIGSGLAFWIRSPSSSRTRSCGDTDVISEPFWWWWKSRRRLGRPRIPKDMRDLIREVSRANPLWERPAFMANCSNSGSISPKINCGEIHVEDPASAFAILADLVGTTGLVYPIPKPRINRISGRTTRWH